MPKNNTPTIFIKRRDIDKIQGEKVYTEYKGKRWVIQISKYISDEDRDKLEAWKFDSIIVKKYPSGWYVTGVKSDKKKRQKEDGYETELTDMRRYPNETRTYKVKSDGTPINRETEKQIQGLEIREVVLKGRYVIVSYEDWEYIRRSIDEIKDYIKEIERIAKEEAERNKESDSHE